MNVAYERLVTTRSRRFGIVSIFWVAVGVDQRSSFALMTIFGGAKQPWGSRHIGRSLALRPTKTGPALVVNVFPPVDRCADNNLPLSKKALLNST